METQPEMFVSKEDKTPIPVVINCEVFIYSRYNSVISKLLIRKVCGCTSGRVGFCMPVKDTYLRQCVIVCMCAYVSLCVLAASLMSQPIRATRAWFQLSVIGRCTTSYHTEIATKQHAKWKQKDADLPGVA